MQDNLGLGMVLGRALTRLDRIEERAMRSETAIARLEAQLAAWRAWGRRGLILALLWGSVALASLNADQASSLLAMALREALRLR